MRSSEERAAYMEAWRADFDQRVVEGMEEAQKASERGPTPPTTREAQRQGNIAFQRRRHHDATGLRAERLRRGMSQAEAGRYTGTSERAIRAIELNEPGRESARRRVASAFRIPIEDLS